MIKHIVFMKMKEDKKNKQQELVKKLHALYPAIPTMRTAEIGESINHGPVHWDVSLIGLFDNDEGLKFYLNHPDHVEVLEFLDENCEPCAVVDYEIP